MSTGAYLEEIYSKLHKKEYLGSDPLQYVHRFQNPWDQEAVGLVAALLAYGNVKQIHRSIEVVLNTIQKKRRTPQELVREFSPDLFSDFVHRFNSGQDLANLLRCLRWSWEQHGALGAHLLSHVKSEDRDITPGLIQLIADWREFLGPLARGGGMKFLISSPEFGSCCKRWCMYLRWMVRDDDLDVGLWGKNSPFPSIQKLQRFVSNSQLVMPLDTHTGRIAKKLRLTHRNTLNWKASQEVTEALREFSPEDPVKYDFSLCRVGILKLKHLE